MPVFVPRSFTEWMGDHNAMLTASDRSRLTKKAVFFPGCYVNDYDPQTGKDLVFMLEKAGYEVIVPDFECCGLPMVANGFFDHAPAAASRCARGPPPVAGTWTRSPLSFRPARSPF